MAGESWETGTVTVSLPAELEDWLNQQAADLGVDQETLLLQLLSTYRTTANGDDPELVESVGDALAREDIEPLVREVLTDRLPDLTEAVAERVTQDIETELQEEIEASITEGLEDEVASAVEESIRADLDTDALEQRMDDLEADYKQKLQDVRERVIQVKRDADDTHTDIEERIDGLQEDVEELASVGDRLDELSDDFAGLDRRTDRQSEKLDGLGTELDGVESELATLRGRLDDAAVEDMADDLEDAQEKLQTVAWVVRDLRESIQGGHGAQTVAEIKRRAAAEDITRAACESCGNGVEIGLLTEPSCPHCDATIDDIEPSKRRFGLGKPTLTVAAGLEAGADDTDEMDQISTERAGERR